MPLHRRIPFLSHRMEKIESWTVVLDIGLGHRGLGHRCPGFRGLSHRVLGHRALGDACVYSYIYEVLDM